MKQPFSTLWVITQTPPAFMNLIYSIPLLLAFGAQTLAADVGLYDISDRSHPQEFQENLGTVTITSQSNNNKRYFLGIRAAPFFSKPCTHYELVVGDKKIHFDSQGMSGSNFTSMETTIEDPDLISRIEQYFHTKAARRHHPGYQMLVEFIPDKAEFKLGEPVTVKLRITNVGDRDFAFIQGGRQRGARDNQFAFSAELVGSKMIPDTGDPRNYGGMGFPVTVQAGHSHETSVHLNRWFDFKNAGTYNLRGSYYMQFITPSDPELDTIWEDFACAEFTIEIKGS